MLATEIHRIQITTTAHTVVQKWMVKMSAGTNQNKLSELDAGQLAFMWNFLKLRKENSCTKEDVRSLKENLDKIRLALVQKTAGQRRGDSESNSVNFGDLGSYVNFVVMDALALYIYGGLDVLENALPERSELRRQE